jgi:hypothetical protein
VVGTLGQISGTGETSERRKGAPIVIIALHKNHGGRRAKGRLGLQDVRYDPVTVAALAEISGSTNCFNRGHRRELRLYSRQTTRTRLSGNATEEKNNRA